jgi:3-oxoacyl-[acyl-carrier-protein] synthase-3
MDGPSLMSFTIGAIPQLIRDMVGKANLQMSDVRLLLMHQATRKMLEHLQTALNVDEVKLPIRLFDRGNTVSSTLPILINDLRSEGKIISGSQNVLVGFGVGWSWAGCLWKPS